MIKSKNAVRLLLSTIFVVVCLLGVLVIPCSTNEEPIYDEEITEDTTPTTETVAATNTVETTKPIKHLKPTFKPLEVLEPVDDIPMIDKYSLELLACVIYQEAGGDRYCDDCRRRVGDVVLNRVNDERYPDTIYDVLTQYRQYGRYYWTGVVWPARASSVYEVEAVERAYRIAREILFGEHSDLYDNGYIYQAEFPQGRDKIYCCGLYFGK